MKEPKVTAEYVQAAFDTQGASSEGAKIDAYAAGLDALLKSAARGFAQTPFEAEPAGFQAAQRRAAP